jgi:hypothetical protein
VAVGRLKSTSLNITRSAPEVLSKFVSRTSYLDLSLCGFIVSSFPRVRRGRLGVIRSTGWPTLTNRFYLIKVSSGMFVSTIDSDAKYDNEYRGYRAHSIIFKSRTNPRY